MKLPFPYALAAEFMLFQTSRKVTLPHLLILICPAVGLAVTFPAALRDFHSMGAAVLVSSVAALALGFLTFKVLRQVMPALQWLVKAGVFPEPDQTRLNARIVSYLGKAGRS